MPEPSLSMAVDDDLPRTVRRERDAREREAREREARERAQREREMGPSMGGGMGPGMGPAPASLGPQPAPMRMDSDDFDLPAPPATVTALDIPFLKLMLFLIKAVLAGIPALLLLGAIMWGMGHALQTFFPALLKLKIMIYVP